MPVGCVCSSKDLQILQNTHLLICACTSLPPDTFPVLLCVHPPTWLHTELWRIHPFDSEMNLKFFTFRDPFPCLLLICPLADLWAIIKAHVLCFEFQWFVSRPVVQWRENHLTRYYLKTLWYSSFFEFLKDSGMRPITRTPPPQILLNSIHWSAAIQLQPCLKVTSHIPAILMLLSSVL